MVNHSSGYIRRRVSRRNTRSNSNNNNNNNNRSNTNSGIPFPSFLQENMNNSQNNPFPLDFILSLNDDLDNQGFDILEASDNDQEIHIFNTSTTIPRPVSKNTNTIIFDLHGIELPMPILFVLLEDQYGPNEIVTITQLQPSIKYCTSSCLILEVLFATAASKEMALHDQGINIGKLRILGTPIVNTIHYNDIFKYQENDFDSSSSLIHWPTQYHPNNTKCTVYTLYNLLITKDVTTIIHSIKDSIIYMENYLKSKKKNLSSLVTSIDTNNNNNDNIGYYGPISMIPSDDSPFIGVFPVQYPGTHIKKNAYFVVVHDHLMNYSIFKNSIQSSSNNHPHPNNNTTFDQHYHRYHGKKSTRLLCFGNDVFYYDRVTFDRTFCFHCKTPDCHFTEDCPFDDVVDNYRASCVHQLSNISIP